MIGDGQTIARLSSAAGYLSCAYDELLAADYGRFGAEVDQLVEIIAAELSWLNAGWSEA